MSELPDGYRFEPDRARLDRESMHAFLANEAYWSQGLPRERMDHAIDAELGYGVPDDVDWIMQRRPEYRW